MRPIVLLGFMAVKCATRAPVSRQGQLYDVLIRGGTVYDGHGGPPVVADVAIAGDRIAAVGRLAEARAALEIDARGLAVAPGFIDMLSHSEEHPRAYGNFARLLGKYVRDEKAMPLEEAVRKLTSFPAATLGIADRGALLAGSFADVVVFDPARVQDHATFDKPHQLATGVLHVLVNGVPVLRDGEPTAARPGRVLRPHRGSARESGSGKERLP